MDTISRDRHEFHHAITITIMPHSRAREDTAQPSRLLIRDTAAIIVDAVTGKPPLPPMPPEDAQLMVRAKMHAIRYLAEAKRFMVSATLPLVWFTCIVMLYAAAHVLKLS